MEHRLSALSLLHTPMEIATTTTKNKRVLDQDEMLGGGRPGVARKRARFVRPLAFRRSNELQYQLIEEERRAMQAESAHGLHRDCRCSSCVRGLGQYQ